MFKSNVGILIHGCHLQAEGWENIVWGEPTRGVYGRVPKGLMQAQLHNADFIFWGTGASEKDGLKESAYTLRHTIQHAHELSMYNGFDPYEIESILNTISHVDLETQNTTEEIRAALGECHKRGVQELILVSSPSHIARCHQEALKILAASNNAHQVLVYATASDTCFANSTAADVAIIEPPHRGDDPMLGADIRMSDVVRSMFGVSPGRRIALLHRIAELVSANRS